MHYAIVPSISNTPRDYIHIFQSPNNQFGVSFQPKTVMAPINNLKMVFMFSGIPSYVMTTYRYLKT